MAILLLRLPTLRSLQPNIIEEIFFSSLLGNFQIDTIIPQILKLKNSSAGSFIILFLDKLKITIKQLNSFFQQ